VTRDELLLLVGRLRRALVADPPGALRDFVRTEERLRLDGEEVAARALADSLWLLAPELPFRSGEDRASFFHALGRFLGSPGPAADLERALEALEVPLAFWKRDAVRHVEVERDAAILRRREDQAATAGRPEKTEKPKKTGKPARPESR